MFGRVNQADPRAPVASFVHNWRTQDTCFLLHCGWLLKTRGAFLGTVGSTFGIRIQVLSAAKLASYRISSLQYTMKCRLARIPVDELRSANWKTEAIG